MRVTRPRKLVKEFPSWRIYQKWGNRISYLGIVHASDKGSALTQAIKEFNITSPEHQARLVVEERHFKDSNEKWV